MSTNQSHMLKNLWLVAFQFQFCFYVGKVDQYYQHKGMSHWQQLGASHLHLQVIYISIFFLGLCFSILASLYCISAFYYVFLFFFLFLFVSSFIYLYIPRRTDTFIGMRMIPTLHHREFPCVQGNTLTITVGFWDHQRFLLHHWTFVSNKEFGYLNILK